MPFCSSTIRRSFAMPSYDAQMHRWKLWAQTFYLVFFCRIERYCVGLKQHHYSTCGLSLVEASALFCTNNHNFMRPLIFVLSFLCICIDCCACICICIATWHNGGGHEWGMPVGHVGASGQFWGIHQRMLRLALFLSTSWSLRLGAATSWSFSGIVIKSRRIQIDLVCNILLNSTSAATNLETSTDR